MKNEFGKTKDIEDPYAIFYGPRGFIWRVLKTYKSKDSERGDQYARWLTAATSDLMQDNSYEYGDVYKAEIKTHGVQVYCTPEWGKVYGDTVDGISLKQISTKLSQKEALMFEDEIDAGSQMIYEAHVFGGKA